MEDISLATAEKTTQQRLSRLAAVPPEPAS
jgi:hypothetical protein